MANATNNKKAYNCAYVQCKKISCTGEIPLGVLVHKYSKGFPAMCQVCSKKGQTSKFVIPPGADTNPEHYQKPGPRNSASPQPASAKNAERERRMAKEISDLKAKLQEKSETEQAKGPPKKDLQKLLSLQKALEEQGLAIPKELEASIKDAKDNAKAPTNDLKSVLGQIKATENSCKQAASTVQRLEANLAEAREKALAGEQKLLELQQLREKLLDEEGWAKNGPNLPMPPTGLSPEDAKNWASAVEAFQQQMAVQRNALETLLAAMQAKYQSKPEDSVPPAQQKPDQASGAEAASANAKEDAEGLRKKKEVELKVLAQKALDKRLADAKGKEPAASQGEEDEAKTQFYAEQEEELNAATKKQKGPDGAGIPSTPSSPSKNTGSANVDKDGDEKMQS